MLANEKLLRVNAEIIEDLGVFISVKNTNNNAMHIDTWREQLFLWHEDSYYGTFFKEMKRDNQRGVVLPFDFALTFFGGQTENSLLTYQWNDTAQMLREKLTKHAENFRQGWISPDFHAWENRDFVWTCANETEENEKVNLFLQKAIHCRISNPTNAAWRRLGELSKDTSMLGQLTEITKSKEEWLKKAGLLEDKKPFKIVLTIEEPEEVKDLVAPWRLSTLLVDKKDESRVYRYQSTKKLLKNWQPFEEEIREEQQTWLRLIPWLEENGQLKTTLSEEEAWLFLSHESQRLLALGTEVRLPSWWEKIKVAKPKLKINANTTATPSFLGLETLIDFDWKISTNGVDLSEEQFAELLEQKKRLVKSGGKWFALNPEFIAQIKKIMAKKEAEGITFRELLEQEFSSETNEPKEAFDEVQFAFEKNRFYKEMIQRLTNLQKVKEYELPTTLNATLREYQKKGMDWLLHLRELGFGSLLADDMGLGKTVQLIAYLLYCKENNLLSSASLIVAPTSVLGNWQKELEKFAPSLKVKLHYGSNRAKEKAFVRELEDVDVVLTSYSLAQIDQDDFKNYQWDMLCLDEAQNIKNAGTKQSRAIRSFAAKHKIALSGTPIENRLSELWTIFDFINPTYLGSMQSFQARFALPIEKEQDKKTAKKLRRYIQPFFLRRTKQDKEVALNLPDKEEEKEYCHLTAEQASIYETIVRDSLEEVEKLDGFARRGYILKMLGKLKQICDHPSLYLKEEQPKKIIERSEKMKKVSELVDAILENNENCLIFTQYLQMGEMIQECLAKKHKKEVHFLRGSTTKAQRDKMIDRFQNKEFPILILSLKAGGTGLNLTAANHVIHFDRWWNPAVENQATDRAHRIGQERFVHVHKLITIGTLEEKIDEMLEKKQQLNENIVSSETWLTELTQEELKELLVYES